MSFEKADNFDYSTEKMDNESIQDKIDAKTLEISELTKESLQELKVDIQNSNSSLTLRDIDGNYLGKVRDNEVLIYEGETKTVNHNGEQKLFLKVRTKTGAIGFVSADYLKAKVNQDKIQIQEATNDSDINIVPDLKTNKPEDNKENRSIIKKVSNEVKKENDDIPKKTIVKNKTTDKDNKEKTSDNSKTREILETKEVTEEELSNSLILKISQIKEISQKTEDLETLGVIWDGEEKINANRTELNVIYSETLLILSKLQETNTPTAQTQVKKMYLFLAEYYSDNKENIENDHLRDYTLSTVNALGVIKDINGCPEFPNLTDIQNKYPQKEDFQRELELAMNAFDARFEDFADKNTNTDPDIIKAIELIEDNRGIGWFDFAEEVTDAIYDNVGGIGAMLAGTVAIVFASPGIIVGGAIAGGSALAGAGINAVVKGESSGREFAADAASLSLQVGAAGTIALKSSAVLAKTAGVWKTAGVLGVEAAADVTVVGVLGEYIHESIEGNEMQWSESFKDNLIWAPLVLLGGGKTVFRESLERAQLRKAMGDTDGVLQEAKIMNRELTNLKENFSGKSFTIDVDGNKYPIEISNVGELKLIDTQRVLDPNIKEDKKVIRAIALEIQNSNKKGNFSTLDNNTSKADQKNNNTLDTNNSTTSNKESLDKSTNSSDLENINVRLDEKSGMIHFDGGKYQIISNNSFYFTSPKNGKLYRIETGDKGQITKVFNTDATRNPNQSLDGKEYSLSGAAKWAVIKNNINEIRDNYSVKVDKKTKVETPKNQTEKVDLATTEKFTHKNNGKTYYRDSEGQFYNEKGHKSSVKEKNLNKVEEKKVKTKNEDVNKSPKEQNEKNTDIKNTNGDVLIANEVKAMKDGDTLTLGDYKLLYKDKEYTLEGPNNYKKDFIDQKSILSALKDKLPQGTDKINIILKQGKDRINKKLDYITNTKEGFEIDGKTIRLKKDGDKYYFQEKNGNNGFKELDMKTLNEQQILDIFKILNEKHLLQDIKNFTKNLNIDKLFSKSEKDGIIKKYGNVASEKMKNKGNKILNDLKKGPGITLDLLMWILRGKKGEIFTYKTALGGIAVNEVLEMGEDLDKYYKDFWTIEHGLSIVGNAFMAKQVGVIRSALYNEFLFEDGYEYVTR